MSDGHWSISLDPDDEEEGWFPARCKCGWEAGGMYPTAEDACDALMGHAFEAGVSSGGKDTGP